jgi:hypothetical protein
LGFDDPNRPFEVAGDFFRFFDGIGNASTGDCNAVSGQQALGLIFMDVHNVLLLPNILKQAAKSPTWKGFMVNLTPETL